MQICARARTHTHTQMEGWREREREREREHSGMVEIDAIKPVGNSSKVTESSHLEKLIHGWREYFACAAS